MSDWKGDVQCLAGSWRLADGSCLLLMLCWQGHPTPTSYVEIEIQLCGILIPAVQLPAVWPWFQLCGNWVPAMWNFDSNYVELPAMRPRLPAMWNLNSSYVEYWFQLRGSASYVATGDWSPAMWNRQQCGHDFQLSGKWKISKCIYWISKRRMPGVRREADAWKYV